MYHFRCAVMAVLICAFRRRRSVIAGGDRKSRMGLLLFFLLSISCNKEQQPKTVPPQRIISVVPNVTETLFAFGQADKVIGVSDFDHVPPEVETRPRVGGLINPDIEKIITMHPDLVIIYGTQDDLRRHLQSVGISVFPYVHGNVAETLQFMRDLGHAVGAGQRAQQVVQEMQQTFDDVRSHAPAIKPKVLVVYSREAGTLGSFFAAGRRSFQSDLVEIAGGRNLFEDVDKEAIEPTLEEVISRKPDIIVETLSPPLDPEDLIQRRKDWKKLGIPENRIYIEEKSYFLVPGPRLGIAARRLSEIVRGSLPTLPGVMLH